MSILVKKISNAYRMSSYEKTKIKSRNFNKIFRLNVALLIFISLILFFYLIEINQVITLGFKIDELEKSKDNLQRTNRNLEIEKIKLESLNNSQEYFSLSGFVKVDNIEYLRPVDGSTLTKK